MPEASKDKASRKSGSRARSESFNKRNKIIDLKKIKIKGKKHQRKKKFSDISKDDKKTIVLVREHIYLMGKRKKEAIIMIVLAIFVLIFLNSINIFYKSAKLKSEVMILTEQGFENLLSTVDHLTSGELDKSEEQIKKSMDFFREAEDKIWFIKNKNPFSPNQGLIKSAANVIEAGKHLATAGFYGIKISEDAKDIISLAYNSKNIPDSLTNRLKSNQYLITDSIEELESAYKLLNKFEEGLLPQNLQDKYTKALAQLDQGKSLLIDLNNFYPAIMEMLGDTHPQKYLVLLANNNERRPIMGFLGSLVLMDVDEGKLKKSAFYDVYHFDGQISEKIPVPKVFEKLTSNWGLRDSNYSPEYSISAQSAAMMLEKGNGPGVDTIITLDLQLVRELLKTIGPVVVEGLSKPVNYENFDLILSLIVESKIEGKTSPKAIIDRFIESVKKKLDQSDISMSVAKTIIRMVKEKHIMAYSKDEDIQKIFEYLELDGRIKITGLFEDYLNLVHTSIGGNKSDKYINEHVSHQSFIDKEGKIINHLTIKREHNWNHEKEKELLELAKDYGAEEPTWYLKEIMGQGQNINNIRVYVPYGSILHDTMGNNYHRVETKYDEELDKTYFQFNIITFASSSSEITLIYELPFKLDFSGISKLSQYKLHVQKQSGSMADPFEKEIILDDELYFQSSFPSFEHNENLHWYDTKLEKDKSFAFLLGKK